MKYMHFKASCAYAALAELVEAYGIHTEDDQIALDMKLPWLFTKENGVYAAGPMLQGAKWFNLWLLPRGCKMTETTLERNALCRYLQTRRPAMLGIQTPYGKHAVVFREYDGRYHFFNPTYEGSGEATELHLCKAELLSVLDRVTTVGVLHLTRPRSQDIAPYLHASISALRDNTADIAAFARNVHEPDAYPPMMDRLFRPLLLDGITMLELAGETALAQEFSALQRDFMTFLRGPRTGLMAEQFSLDKLQELTEAYVRLIQAHA